MFIPATGESGRIDYIIREHEKLQRRVAHLEQLLQTRGIVTGRDLERAEPPPDSSAHLPSNRATVLSLVFWLAIVVAALAIYYVSKQ